MSKNISDPHIMKSSAGYYIGRICEESFDEVDKVMCIPFDRLSDYFSTEEAAKEYFEASIEQPSNAANYVANDTHPFITTRIRQLNDRLRMTGEGGTIVQTQGFAALDPQIHEEFIRKVRTFEDFDFGDDPYGQHDFGHVKIGTLKVFWKIDYLDLSNQYASEYPENDKITNRVMTFMLASEY